MVRIHPDPPTIREQDRGAIAQLGERLLCKQEVTGSIPVGSTSSRQALPVRQDLSCAVHETASLFNKLEDSFDRRNFQARLFVLEIS